MLNAKTSDILQTSAELRALPAGQKPPTGGLTHCHNCGARLVADRNKQVGPLVVDGSRASWAGKDFGTSSTQRRMLKALISAYPKHVSKREMIKKTGTTSFIDPDGVLKVQIFHLRKKLEAVGAPKSFIEVVWGNGYRLSVGSAA